MFLEHDVPILEPNDEAVRIADLYISENIIPQKYRLDCLHIAIATVNDLNMIISMNFQHIVKRKTKLLTGNINTLNGYHAVLIDLRTRMHLVLQASHLLKRREEVNRNLEGQFVLSHATEIQSFHFMSFLIAKDQ